MAKDKIDIKDLLAQSGNDIYTVVNTRIALKRRGANYLGHCPFHSENTPSFTVSPKSGKYKCYGCGAYGDALDFIVRYDGIDVADAIKQLQAGTTIISTDKEQLQAARDIAAKNRKEWKPAPMVPVFPENDIPPPPTTNYNGVKWAARYDYKDADGKILGYYCRFVKGTEKVVLPLTWCTDGTNFAWRWQALEKPRPLYGLDLLAQNPDADVILVEGEKTADALQGYLDDAIFITWPGGTNGVEHVDWAPLHGRNVFAWPDNDAVGLGAMLHIHCLVGDKFGSFQMLPLNFDLPKGWDGADKEWPEDGVAGYISVNVLPELPAPTTDVPEIFVAKHGKPIKIWVTKQPGDKNTHYFGYAEKNPEWWVFEKYTPTDLLPATIPPATPNGSNVTSPIDSALSTPYFRFLGYDKSDNGQMAFYFFVYASRQVIRLSPGGMTKSNLLQLAELKYWEDRYSNKNGFSIEAAVNELIAQSVKAGYFDDDLLRGRGAWLDNGNVVLHVGDSLFVNGKRIMISEHPTEYIYEGAKRIKYNENKGINGVQGKKLLDFFELLSWERPINAYLAAGWCVIAPFCGVLSWRPHIWIIGPAGSGKSWVYEKVVRPLLGNMALAVQGPTSDAGLRQALGHDALPVVFDEAEADGKKELERVKDILQLIRSASTDDGGAIIKGTAGGSFKSYRIRSCFAFASIALNITQQADRSRITVLGMRNDDGAEQEGRRRKTAKMQLELLTDEYISGLRARTMGLIPTILQNAKVFAAAASEVIGGGQRTGDQLGAMLAGAYSLKNTQLIKYDDAVAWLKERDWSEERAANQLKDENRLLSAIVGKIIQVENAGAKLPRTIGELITIAAHRGEFSTESNEPITAANAQTNLRRVGIRVELSGESGEVWFSNTSIELSALLGNMPGWTDGRSKILLRLPGARNVEPHKFAGETSRSVAVPLDLIIPPGDGTPPSPATGDGPYPETPVEPVNNTTQPNPNIDESGKNAIGTNFPVNPPGYGNGFVPDDIPF